MAGDSYVTGLFTARTYQDNRPSGHVLLYFESMNTFHCQVKRHALQMLSCQSED